MSKSRLNNETYLISSGSTLYMFANISTVHNFGSNFRNDLISEIYSMNMHDKIIASKIIHDKK